jgi:hypothetical protein
MLESNAVGNRGRCELVSKLEVYLQIVTTPL